MDRRKFGYASGERSDARRMRGRLHGPSHVRVEIGDRAEPSWRIDRRQVGGTIGGVAGRLSGGDPVVLGEPDRFGSAWLNPSFPSTNI